MFTNIFKSMFSKAILATAVLGGALAFAGAPNAKADEHGRDRDRDRIVRRDNDYRFRGDFDRRESWRAERREAFARGYYDRFGCWHRY